ncbi:MAG: phosphoribosyl-AMP cyclohydrolase [Spirochaetota bacterium]
MLDLRFDRLGGIVPAVVQDFMTGEVLMVAFMNEEAWKLTRETGYAHYWSRSRKRIWKKGETSGNVQEVKEIRIDCDEDCVLLKVHQVGEAACHTGYRSCFYRILSGDDLIVEGKPLFNPAEKYGGSNE